MSAWVAARWEGFVDTVKYYAYAWAGIEPNCLPACSCDAVHRFKLAVKALKREVVTLYYASLDDETGWLPRVLVLIAVGYALSPIDLIPDCIPVLGLVDDFLILPILLWLARRLVPAAVLERARMRQELEPSLILPSSLGAAIFVGLLWLAAAEAVSAWLANAFSLPQRQQLVAMLSMGLVFTGVYCMVIARIIRDRKPGVAEPSAGDYHMMPPPPPDVPL